MIFFSLPCSLTRSLAKAHEKIRALEEQIDQLLKEKNSTIQELEGRVRGLEQELQLARERAEHLGQKVELLESSQAEGESSAEVEMRTGTNNPSTDTLSEVTWLHIAVLMGY